MTHTYVIEYNNYTDYEQETIENADNILSCDSVMEEHPSLFMYNEYEILPDGGIFIQIGDIIAHFESIYHGIFCYTANKDMDDLTMFERSLLTTYGDYSA